MQQNHRLLLMLGALAVIAGVAIMVTPPVPANNQPQDQKPYASIFNEPAQTQETAQAQNTNREQALVTRVVDGDTVVVNLNGTEEKIRLIGINTPETVDPRRPVECFGKEASAKTKELLANQSVFLEADESQQNRDKYDRLLRYIFLPDGTNVNLKLIDEGFAYEYTYDYPYKYQQQFKRAQAEAQNTGRGLWAEDACAQG